MMRRLFSLLLIYSVLLTQGVAPISASLVAARQPFTHDARAHHGCEQKGGTDKFRSETFVQ